MAADDEFDEILRAEMIRLVDSAATNDFTVEPALDNVTQAALNLIAEVNCADILLIEDGNFQSMAPTAELAYELDDAQRRLGQGPCFDCGHSGLDRTVPRSTRRTPLTNSPQPQSDSVYTACCHFSSIPPGVALVR